MAQGVFTSQELVRACLERNPAARAHRAGGAFLDEGACARQARAADERRRSGEPSAP